MAQLGLTVTGTLVTFGLLGFAVLALWLPPTIRIGRLRPWSVLFIAAIAAALFMGILGWTALLWIALFAYLCRLLGQRRFTGWRHGPLIGLVVAGTLALGMHALPGFYNPQIVDNVRLTPDAVPYSLYLSFDKATAGLLLLAFVVPLRPLSEGRYGRDLGRAGTVWLVTCLVAFSLALLAGYIDFAPKVPDFLWLWAGSNLFITAMTEEAFFRGFIQQRLAVVLGRFRHGDIAAVLIAAGLFGVAHIGGGALYVGLATVAGIGYGTVYHWTRRIELAALAHFMLNLAHVLLFTYPRLD